MHQYRVRGRGTCCCRVRVKGLGGTMAEREQAVVRCLPKLGVKAEQQRLLRVDLTRLLQQLRVGVRYVCMLLCSTLGVHVICHSRRR